MEKGYSLRPAKPVLSELQQCVLEITNGDLTYREAQEKYGFSKSTLQRHAVRGSQTPLSAGAPSKLTDIEFESIAEKCRANFIGNQQTDVTTLKKYVADVTGARGVQWLNGVPSDKYMLGLINRLKSRGIQFVTGRPTSTARVAANSSQHLAPFFEVCKVYRDFFLTEQGGGQDNPARWAVFDEKPIISRAEKTTLLGKVCTVPDLAHGQAPRRKSIDDGPKHTSLISTLLFDGSFLPNGYLFSGKCLQEKIFSDPLPPGVSRERINSLFTVPTEHGVQTKESFKLFLRQHVYPNHRKRVPTGWLVWMFDRPECHNTGINQISIHH